MGCLSVFQECKLSLPKSLSMILPLAQSAIIFGHKGLRGHVGNTPQTPNHSARPFAPKGIRKAIHFGTDSCSTEGCLTGRESHQVGALQVKPAQNLLSSQRLSASPTIRHNEKTLVGIPIHQSTVSGEMENVC